MKLRDLALPEMLINKMINSSRAIDGENRKVRARSGKKMLKL